MCKKCGIFMCTDLKPTNKEAFWHTARLKNNLVSLLSLSTLFVFVFLLLQPFFLDSNIL